MFNMVYEGNRFLKLLNKLSALNDSVAERLICFDGLEVISIAIQGDPNYEKSLMQVVNGTEILWHIRHAENGKHVRRVSRDKGIIEGILRKSS